MNWDGITDRERFNGWYLDERDQFADMARDADWNGLFQMLGKNPGWANLPRPGNRSGFTALHQAAWHGADFPVVSRLLAHGAWRTQRSRDGRRAVDIARERGHTHLLQLLEPVAVRQLPAPSDALEHHFRSLLREATGRCFGEIEHLLPPLSPLAEGPSVKIFFQVIGMMGGFFYHLEHDHVHVNASSRMDYGDGDHYRVTPQGFFKIDETCVPPPPLPSAAFAPPALTGRRARAARPRKASWTSSHCSQWIRRRRKPCSQEMVRSTTQRKVPRPVPCGRPRSAMGLPDSALPRARPREPGTECDPRAGCAPGLVGPSTSRSRPTTRTEQPLQPWAAAAHEPHDPTLRATPPAARESPTMSSVSE